MPCLGSNLCGMSHQPRHIYFLERDGPLKHYGIGLEGAPRRELVSATRRAAGEVVPDGAVGFAISHDAATAGLGIVYWWANYNEIHQRAFASPRDDPGALVAADGTGMACVWELEVIDFERRAWLDDVLKGEDVERYLGRNLAEVEL
jgi:hypothetical protein